MRRNSVIFGILCALMVVSMVNSTSTDGESLTSRLVAAERTETKVWTTAAPAVP